MGNGRAFPGRYRCALQQLQVLDPDDQCRIDPARAVGRADKDLERPTQARLGSTRLGILLGAIQVTGKNRITAIELGQEPLHEARRRGTGREPVVNPLTVADPLNQPGLTEDAQMSADARLALPYRLCKIRNAEITLIAQSKQAQTAGLARRLQPRN